MNPKKLEPFLKAHEQRIKEMDMMNWYQGQYFASAINATVGNMFKKKGARAIEYINKPFIQEFEERKHAENMTEEEKIKATEEFFMSLKIMQANFELSRKAKGGQA